MDTNDPPRRVLPKRKRKETSYFPTDSEDSDVELEETGDNGVGDGTSLHNKKVKLSAPSKPAKPLLKKQIFPFTSLPPELKNKIYEYVLTSEHEVPIVWKLRQYRHIAVLGDTDSFQAFLRRGRYSYLSKPAKQVQTPSFGPSILRLNRQFYAETLPILYGANTFAFENTHAMLAFCACIKPKNCALLRQVSLKHMGYSKGTKALNNPGFAQLASAVNLTRLIMDCSIHYSGRGDQIARQFYRDAHHWLEAVASNKGRRDAAVEIVELGVENVRYYGYTSDNEDASRAKLLAITASFHDELRRMLLQA
ncbi:MAG: hypothetical protein L6R41_006652 [Letrouitia leprolyta]|nr:MAG: hypothetical protein L6R41_006652 [Letrouitia leprolyta]